MPRTRKVFTVETKLRILQWKEDNHASLRRTAQEFGINKTQVSQWMKLERQLREVGRGKMLSCRRMHPGREQVSELLDQQLFDFLVDQRTRGLAVKNTDLQKKALELAENIEELGNFRASMGFIWRWKRRFSVVRRRKTNESQKTPDDLAERLQGFLQDVREARYRSAVSNEDIWNMDQTMVWFDMPARYSNDVRGSRQVRVKTSGCTKRGFTVALCCSSAGMKMPALVIFKEPRGVLGPRVQAQIHPPPNVRVTATTNGWMTQQALLFWLKEVFGQDERGENPTRLLVLDSYKTHTTDESVMHVEDACNSDLVIVPAGCTSLIQPLDVSVNRSFKSQMRNFWSEWMQGAHDLTPAGNIRPPTRQNVITWVSQAWYAINEGIIVEAFKRCGISNALDGSEDHLMSPHIPVVQIQPAELHVFELHRLNDDEEPEGDPDDEVFDIADMEPF